MSNKFVSIIHVNTPSERTTDRILEILQDCFDTTEHVSDRTLHVNDVRTYIIDRRCVLGRDIVTIYVFGDDQQEVAVVSCGYANALADAHYFFEKSTVEENSPHLFKSNDNGLHGTIAITTRRDVALFMATSLNKNVVIDGTETLNDYLVSDNLSALVSRSIQEQTRSIFSDTVTELSSMSATRFKIKLVAAPHALDNHEQEVNIHTGDILPVYLNFVLGDYSVETLEADDLNDRHHHIHLEGFEFMNQRDGLVTAINLINLISQHDIVVNDAEELNLPREVIDHGFKFII